MFEEIKCVNTEEGLSRLGGNMTLYKKLLGSFKDSAYLKDIDAQMKNGDAAAAAVAAHTFKGVTGNLSLARLNAITVELEKQLKEGKLPLDYLPVLQVAFDATVEEIAQL